MNGYEISLKLCTTCNQYCRAITVGNKLAYGRICFLYSLSDLNSHLLFPGKLMKFIDNTWRVIAENERLQLSKTEGQVRRVNCCRPS